MINLTLRNKSFHGRDILTNHNLSFSQDGFYVIMGPSGVGKSTLLNIIGLLDLEFNGEYLFYGNNINAKNLEDYLSCDKIICCGGSWMVKGDLVKAGEFDKIKELTAEAKKLVDSIRK